MMIRAFIESILLYLLITPILLHFSIVHSSSDIVSYKFFIVAPLYFLISGGKAYLLLNIIDKFTSQVVSFVIISESLAGSIHEIFSINKYIVLSIAEIILALLIGITTLIYVEIITINKFGLNKDQRHTIHQNGINDISQIYDDQDDKGTIKLCDTTKTNQSN